MTVLEWINSERPFVSRAVVRAVDRKKGEPTGGLQVLHVIRPDWGKDESARDRVSLPGGRPSQKNYDTVLTRDPSLEFNEEQLLIAVGFEALMTRMIEELSERIKAVDNLRFAGQSTNDAGWTSLIYVADIPRKIRLDADEEGNGTVWINQDKIRAGKVDYLAGHGQIAIAALDLLDSLKK